MPVTGKNDGRPAGTELPRTLRTWKQTPLILPLKIIFYGIACFMCGALAVLIVLRPNVFAFIALVFGILFIVKALRVRRSITATATDLRITDFFSTRRIRWADITEYHYDEPFLVLGTGGGDDSKIRIDTSETDEQASFIEYINTKLSTLPVPGCLQCGAPITLLDSRCPKCGWTWKQNG